MELSKDFLEYISLHRSFFVWQFLEDEKYSPKKSSDSSKRVLELDRIDYTIDFLMRQNLISVQKRFAAHKCSVFSVPLGSSDREVVDAQALTSHQLKSKTSWEISVASGFINFKANGYKTDEQLKEDRTFKLTIGAALLASFATAAFSGLASTLFDSCVK